MTFSLERFEAHAYSRNLEMGARELLALLQHLDSNYGALGAEFEAQPLQSISAQDRDQHLWTRAAAAATALLSNPDLFFSPEWRIRVLMGHRWLSALFAATAFRNSDHIMRAMNRLDPKEDLNNLEIGGPDILKFCLVYSPESEVALDLDAVWAGDPALAAGLCMVLLSPRFLGSPAAHAKREIILPWLSERLDRVTSLEELPISVLHDVYMHCSYADLPAKHDIKKPINTLIRRKLAEEGLLDAPVVRPPASGPEKPVLLVVLEWFTCSHSIYRTHSLTLEGARERFHVLAVGYADCVDEVTLRIFDEVVFIDRQSAMIEQLRQIRSLADERQAAICYMPSVGMFPLTMWLANLRVCPLQMVALGHPATTHSDAIDYVVVEEDFVGDEACFSEKLLKLPKDGMPYRPSAAAEGLNVLAPPNPAPDVVRIAVCATTMKLNPGFLNACRAVLERCTVPVHFHFLVGQAQGLIYPSVQRVVKEFLGDAVTVYPHQAYRDYMQVIGHCDLFANPFPFGNTNGIVDTVSAGLVGVCKTGPEVHEHIDEGLFRRLGFPDWLIADSVEDYIDAVVRLASDHAERKQLRTRLAGPERVKILYRGRKHVLGERMLALVRGD